MAIFTVLAGLKERWAFRDLPAAGVAFKRELSEAAGRVFHERGLTAVATVAERERVSGRAHRKI